MEYDFADPKVQRMTLDTLYRTEFAAFAARALQVIQPDFQSNWHTDAIIQYGAQVADGAIRYGIVNGPPRSLKSVILSAVLPSFMLGQNPRTQLICVSRGQDLAHILADLNLRIMQSPFYRRVFPNTRLARKAKDDFSTTAGGSRYATSINGGVTGRGADLIIVDDPINAADSDSETVRPGVNAWFDQTLPTRLNDPTTGGMLIVMQRTHQDDLTGHLMHQRLWDQLVIPAQTEIERRYDLGYRRTHIMKPGDVMHPERMPLSLLEEKRISLGTRIFNAQYLQDPSPAGGLIFKRDWLRYEAFERRSGDRVVQSWDCASKTGDRNDYSACITAIVRRNQVLIVDVFRGRLDFPDLKRKAIALAGIYKPIKLFIEDASAGAQLIQMLAHEMPPGVPLPIPVKATRDKLDRASIAEARVQSGAMILPARAPWLNDFVEELVAFPNGRFDDQVDALAHLMANTQTDFIRPILPWFGDNTTPSLMTEELHRNLNEDLGLDYWRDRSEVGS